MWHARRFDFLCDDAFIALRYARTWAATGAPVYNPGERVEGYTSFLFTAAVALLTHLGLDPPAAARLLGALGAVALLAASLALLRGLLGRRSWRTSVVFVALLALSAPVAAWSLGGLETTVFAALASAGLSAGFAGFRAQDRSRRQRLALLAGATLGLATLARPEGALFFGALFLSAAGLVLRRRRGGGELLRLGLGYLAVVAPHEAWRWSYYGYPLPNTFYVKSTGAAAELWARGLRYGELALREMNPALVLAGVGGLLVPGSTREQAAALWTLRIVLLTGVLYVLRIGGDFLDLYRFFVPFWPLALVAALRPLAVLERVACHLPWGRAAVGGLGLLLVMGHGLHQRRVADRAMQLAEPERAVRHLEPLGWTRVYALRWAAVGRWIADLARPGDTLAVGAAGAMPYFAGLPNLDLFGLCDAHVAHHGHVIGTRPGHQRFAPHGYLLERRPTFLFLNPEAFFTSPRPLGPDPRWNPLGWVWAEVILDPQRHGIPEPLRLPFLLRRERAEELQGHPAIRVAEDNPR